jgi:hypothetical protein
MARQARRRDILKHLDFFLPLLKIRLSNAFLISAVRDKFIHKLGAPLQLD